MPSFRTLAVASLLLATLPAGAAAQQAEAGPDQGAWSLMFQLFEQDNGINLGAYNLVTGTLKIGVEVELSYAGADSRLSQQVGTIPAEVVNWTLNVGPSVWWYFRDIGPISPFVRAKSALGWGQSKFTLNEVRQEEEQSSSISGSAALGAEWFPLPWLGLAGHTGFFFTRTSLDELDGNLEILVSRTLWNLRTFRSGILVNLYF